VVVGVQLILIQVLVLEQEVLVVVVRVVLLVEMMELQEQ
jgi:hypothetical protein